MYQVIGAKTVACAAWTGGCWLLWSSHAGATWLCWALAMLGLLWWAILGLQKWAEIGPQLGPEEKAQWVLGLGPIKNQNKICQ